MAPTVSSYMGKAARKTHTKSRLGCGNCKRRKIKCDEVKPSCKNCLRHSVHCDYTITSSTTEAPSSTTPIELAAQDGLTFISSLQADFKPPKRAYKRREGATSDLSEQSSIPEASSALGRRPFQFSATDLALFHHLMTCADLGADQSEWQTQMTRWGFQHHYVLRLLLAFAGFHLAQNPAQIQQIIGQDVDYAAEAEKHYDIAVREAAAAVSQITGCNGQVVYMGACFIFTCSLARGPQPGEYLGFRDDGGTGCLSLLMGVRSIREICSTVLSLQVDVHTSENHAAQDHTMESDSLPAPPQPRPPSQTDPPATVTEHLDQLSLLVDSTYPPHQSIHLEYTRLLDDLKQTYSAVHPPPDLPGERVAKFPFVFGWLYRLPDSVLHDLQRRHPLALTVFAFFTVLLKDMDVAWFIRGWPEHILDGCWRNLDEFHRQFILWPMQQLRVS
ncbi:hypothetical protein ASPCAL09384 [Aspergillus calidoustus]|uniref:Zn(2)-C6 fungal-type domain-containing protein n=1 Tax=Aspergillus calidoustus TaxID=454130 RepID=A0A0U5GXJ4_ASPCI|nr:hypothetical protein ASPCAL09384 [Aspergillus calidoustus]